MDYDDDPDAGAPGSAHGPDIRAPHPSTICCGWDFLTILDVHHHRITAH
ncbi:hypothetical protein SEA_RUDY_102 [Microbacterium phage Rudy]|uniref:C2H2-type domain-containing protein n=1 Tax=Microbacterium phage Judebell TaxID=3230835 RepID=A0AAU8EIK4_9CAUD|nr:hypothetical protein SEA_RUDY_102 [Microbacterium phage Rudy]QWY80589.1 hypothetical protein SEA_QUAMMI_104 [Microbacterium phage Quammi]UVG33948.1 hypothetical protein SEA_VICEROY_103 [Microbacterium phage Viceroy]UVG34054.1 hypothetical protein SEA_WHEELIE_103 [Microbacterium phage Wheelie]UVG34366.1 hypothetical protein SEA_GRASSBOY_109 [Microbacterium phage Grassboy]UVG35459.1 hypothetical protein SEA_ZAGIE_106 [Microbacterium phage Zagie]WNM75213.1 hypothetical protein SEA_LONELYSOIL_